RAKAKSIKTSKKQQNLFAQAEEGSGRDRLLQVSLSEQIEAKIDSKIGRLENKMDKQNAHLENKMDKLENKMDKLENKIDKLENKMDLILSLLDATQQK
ncbi:hypothetical protein THAOC_06058, partial [Thalassiosira oceanica]